MRRLPTARTPLRVAAAALALSLTLAACSGESATDADPTPSATSTDLPEAEQSPSAEDVAAMEGIEVAGDPGSEPTITLPETPFNVSAAVARVLDEGTGEDIAEGDIVDLHSVWVNGEDGENQASSWSSGAPEQVVVSAAALAPVLTDILVGGKVGTRFAFAVPGSETGASVAVAEVVGKRPGRAEGTAVEPAAGLPTVTLGEDGEPSIETVDGDPPTELVVQPLIEGEGPAVESGQTLLAHYSGWLWDGTSFDSSWSRDTPTPFGIGTGQVIPGWDEGLVGQKVGSQVLLIVPPDKGYGDEGSGENIPGGSTLIFVVDILGAS